MAIGVWKAWTLGPFLPYHVRNDFSDIMWFNFLAGVRSENYPLAAKVIRRLAERGEYPQQAAEFFTKAPVTPFTPFSGPASWLGRLKQAITGYGDDIDIDKLVDDVVASDLLHKGMHEAETVSVAGKMTAPLKKPVEYGGIREDWGRLAHFLDRRVGKGWAINEAVEDVYKYHYNYAIDALTPFERFLPNRMFFFYRWMRNNIPGSIRNMFEHWGKHSAVAKGLRAIEEEAAGGAYEKYMPAWMKERGPIRVPEWVPLLGGKKGETRYFMTAAWWPFAELSELARLGKVWEPSEAMRPIVERLAPPIKIPAELGFGREHYYDKPIKLYPGQRRDLLGVEMPAELGYLMRQWRGVTEVERARRRWERTEGTGAKIADLLRSGMLGAKSYTFDPEREAGQRFFEAIEQMGVIKGEMKRAEAAGKDKTYEYLQQLLDELSGRADEYRDVAGY